VPPDEQATWRAFGADYGFLFQVVDDLLDDDGLAQELGRDETRDLAAQAESTARAKLEQIDADTSVLHDLVDELTARIP
jgi:geranylgeranyl pyrophosphate synthase